MSKIYDKTKKHILEAIENDLRAEDLDLRNLSDLEKFKFCFNWCMSEVYHHHSSIKNLTHWLQSLALDIYFMNYDIEQHLKSCYELQYTIETFDNGNVFKTKHYDVESFIENWFSYCANLVINEIEKQY